MGWQLPRRTARLVFDRPYDGAEVVVSLNIPLGKLVHYELLFGTVPVIHPDVLAALVDIIEGWNLVDAENNAIPVSVDGFLALDDVAFVHAIISAWRRALSETVDVEVPFVQR